MPVTINGSTGLTGVAAIDNVSSTELGYVDGVTSAIQTQINGKGTISTNGAWQTWSPTISAETGTATSTTVNTARYMQIGKLMVCHLEVTVNNKGTASNRMKATLPVNSEKHGYGVGRENNITGTMAWGIVTPGSDSLWGLTSGAIWTDGYKLSVIFQYEAV